MLQLVAERLDKLFPIKVKLGIFEIKSCSFFLLFSPLLCDNSKSLPTSALYNIEREVGDKYLNKSFHLISEAYSIKQMHVLARISQQLVVSLLYRFKAVVFI